MKTTTSNKYNTVNYKKLQHNKHSIQPPNISKAPIGEVIPSSSPKIADERKTTLTTESDIDRLHQKEEILQPSKGIIKDKIPTKPSEDIDALTIKKEAEKYPKRETNRQGQSINLKIIIIPIIVISVIGIVFAWNYLGSISSNNKIIDNTPDKEQIPSSISTGILNIVEGASITGNQNYQPNDLTIKQGSILTINNLDSTIHTVSQGNPNNLNSSIIFDSGIIRSEESYELDTSNIPLGSFEYYCVFHPYMTGKLNIIK
jgi:plastocyanin